jgi:hypothetical protein
MSPRSRGNYRAQALLEFILLFMKTKYISPYLVTRMQDKALTHGKLTDHLKMWQSSYIWKGHQQIKITLKGELKTD